MSFFSAVSVWEWLGCLSHFQQYFSYIVAVSLIGGGNQRKPPQVTDKLYHMYRLYFAWVGFELTTLVVVGSDCIGSCKSNYYTITTMTAPLIIRTDVLIGMSHFSCLSKRHIQPFWADKYLFFCCLYDCKQHTFCNYHGFFSFRKWLQKMTYKTGLR